MPIVCLDAAPAARSKDRPMSRNATRLIAFLLLLALTFSVALTGGV
ncbi:hypothetical protein [Rhodobacter xanthinilyticus]|nr:hypothetical protein [Rhodobacter xanthinilyticus]